MAWVFVLSYVAFSEAPFQGFPPVVRVSRPSAWVNGFKRLNKAEINVISALSNLIAELSLHTVWHTECCKRYAPDVLHVVCTGLHPDNLSVCVGDSLWQGKKIVINLKWCLLVSLLLQCKEWCFLVLYHSTLYSTLVCCKGGRKLQWREQRRSPLPSGSEDSATV